MSHGEPFHGLNTSAAADYLGVSLGSVRRWCDMGALKHWRTPGGQRRFNREDLDALMASLTPSDKQEEA